MADPTRNEGVLDDAAKLAAAARDRGMEQLEGAKGQLAEGAERVAAAVERTAEELDGEGAGTISGFGQSVASLMRQLAGGLRERDIEQFASELGDLARRNPGVFLAGSVALGFGVARFFKARPPQRAARYDSSWQNEGEPPRTAREEFDAEESLDLSANPAAIRRREDDDHAEPFAEASADSTGQPTAARVDAAPKARSTGKKAKAQRASSSAAPTANEGAATEPREPAATDGWVTDGREQSALTGGGTTRGVKGS